MRKRKKKGAFDRRVALSARPEQTPTIGIQEREDGGVQVSIRLQRRPWLGLFGKYGDVERTFGLDPLGREVYEACSGKADVKTLIRRFARNHKVSRAEAELAVTTFLKTLLQKGLIVMAVDKDRLKGKDA
jgi:hypothetical protein